MGDNNSSIRLLSTDDNSAVPLFIDTPFGYVEVDYRIKDRRKLIPTRRGVPHPDPQHWLDISSAARKRDGWRCVISNHKVSLEVHHRTYERWGQEELRDVYTLCHACHSLFHRQGRLAA